MKLPAKGKEKRSIMLKIDLRRPKGTLGISKKKRQSVKTPTVMIILKLKGLMIGINPPRKVQRL